MLMKKYIKECLSICDILNSSDVNIIESDDDIDDR